MIAECTVCWKPILTEADYNLVRTGNPYQEFEPAHVDCVANHAVTILVDEYED